MMMVIQDYNIYELSKKEKRDFFISCEILISIILYLFFQSPLVIVITPIFFVPATAVYKERLARKRKDLLINQFRDLLYSLSSSISAGRHMGEALTEARDNLQLLYPADTPMLAELDSMKHRMISANESEGDLLLDFGKRSGIKDIITFAEIYEISKTTGADLVRVIGITSQMLIDKLTIVRDTESYIAQKKFEGRVIAALPPIIIVFLNSVSPGYLEPLYSTTNGRLIMALALALTAIGFYMADKIMDIKVWDDKKDKRVLRSPKKRENTEEKQRKHN